MTAQSVGGSLEKLGYEEGVGMLEKWENGERDHQNDGKRARQPLTGLLIVSFQRFG